MTELNVAILSALEDIKWLRRDHNKFLRACRLTNTPTDVTCVTRDIVTHIPLVSDGVYVSLVEKKKKTKGYFSFDTGFYLDGIAEFLSVPVYVEADYVKHTDSWRLYTIQD